MKNKKQISFNFYLGMNTLFFSALILSLLVGNDFSRALISAEPFKEYSSNHYAVGLSLLNLYHYLKSAALFLSLIYGVIFIFKFSKTKFFWFVGLIVLGGIGQFIAIKLIHRSVLDVSIPLIWLIRFSFLFSYISLVGLIPWLFFYENDGKDPQYLRGSFQVKKNIQAFLKRYAKKDMLGANDKGVYIWKDCFIPRSFENQHILLAGSTGSGKTKIVYSILDQIRNRGDKVILWDVKGTYTQAIGGEPGVKILAPWDKRSMRWGLINDIYSQTDCSELAHILVPENTNAQQTFFQDSARQIIEMILLDILRQRKPWSWETVIDYVSHGKEGLIQKIELVGEDRMALSLIEGDSKSSHDIFSTVISSLRPMRWMTKAWTNSSESLRRWILEEEGVLIIGGNANYQSLAQTTANMALYVLLNQILSLPDDVNDQRRIWLILDEFTSLGKNNDISKALAMGRSKGLCCVLGIQDFSQMEHHYGAAQARSIANSFLTTMILRCTDIATSDWASRLIGEHEVLQETQTEGHTTNKSNIFDVDRTHSSSRGESYATKRVFLSSEISNFERLSGVIKVAGWPVAKVTWPNLNIPHLYRPVIEAGWVGKIPETKTKVVPKADKELSNRWRLNS